MALDPVKNFAKVELSTGYASGVTSVNLVSGDGAKLPDPSSDGSFNLVWWNSSDYSDPADDPNVEIVRCTARSTDTLTIIRAQEGTSDVNHNTSGKTYKMVLAPTKKFRDDIEARLAFSSRARAYLSGSAQSIPDSTSTKIQLDTENYDGLGEFDPVTNHRFTAQNAGYYLICGSVLYTQPVDGGSYVARIHKNGVEITGQSLIAAANNKHISPLCTDIVYLDVGDYLELYTWHDSGTAKNAYNNTRTFMAVHRIS